MKLATTLLMAIVASAAPVKTPGYIPAAWSLPGILTILPHKANETASSLHQEGETTLDTREGNKTAVRPRGHKDYNERPKATTGEILWSSLVMLGSRGLTLSKKASRDPNPSTSDVIRPRVPASAQGGNPIPTRESES